MNCRTCILRLRTSYRLGVESDLPEDLKKEACLRFQAAVENRMAIGDAIEKVQAEVLVKCNDVFKGKRYKGFIKFDYETNVITIHVKKSFGFF